MGMFEDIYQSYLLEKNEENRKERYDGNEGWYHASGAGLCSRKLYFESVEKTEPTNPSNKGSMRRMRVGTLVHEDIQNSLILYNNIKKHNIEHNIEHNILHKNITENITQTYRKLDDVKFDIEGEVRLPSLNVRGFYDVLSRDFSAGETVPPIVKLYDIKTAASYAWSRMFSRKNMTPQTSRNHHLQLGTYGLGLKEKYGDIDQMSIIHYNKDNSTMRETVVPNMFIDEARRYWYSINEEHSKGIPGFNFGTSPANAWICGFCQFKSRCNPPPKF